MATDESTAVVAEVRFTFAGQILIRIVDVWFRRVLGRPASGRELVRSLRRSNVRYRINGGPWKELPRHVKQLELDLAPPGPGRPRGDPRPPEPPAPAA